MVTRVDNRVREDEGTWYKLVDKKVQHGERVLYKLLLLTLLLNR